LKENENRIITMYQEETVPGRDGIVTAGVVASWRYGSIACVLD